MEEVNQQIRQYLKQVKNNNKQYEIQKNYQELTANFSKNPKIQAFFTDLLTTYGRKFANIQQLNNSNYPLLFGGFYLGKKEDGENSKTLGNALFTPENKQTVISLNQFYLLNKLGYSQFLTNPYVSCEISFKKMIKTCSHEIAHYIQFVKYGESSCKSDLGTDNYIAKLAKEHKEFTREIYQLIKNSGEYSE